jgi:hypothetical protein
MRLRTTYAAYPLTQKQVTAVLKCQDTIKEQGEDFTETKLEDLEDCLDAVLTVQLDFENGLISQAQYNAELGGVRQYCLNQYQSIGKASTHLINRIIKDCSGVASIILPATKSQYDPLEFGATGINYDNVTDLAGAVCEAKELAVDFAVFFEVPRMANLLDILDNDTTGSQSGTFSIEGPNGTEIPNIPLDPRCNVAGLFATPTPTPTPTATSTPTPTT